MAVNNLPLDLNNLTYNNYKITIILDDNNEPWFKANDITLILKYSNTDQAIRKIIDDDDIITLKNSIYINILGLYLLIFDSKNKESKDFKKWLFGKILPLIRSQNEYKLKNKIYDLSYKFETKLKIIQTHNFKLKQFIIDKINHLNKNTYIYIATTTSCKKQHYYIVDGCDIKFDSKKLDYIYLYFRPCNNYKIIKDKISNYLKDFKPNNNKDMYNIIYEDLENLVNTILDNNDAEIDYVNSIYNNLVNNVLDNNLSNSINLPNDNLKFTEDYNLLKTHLNLQLNKNNLKKKIISYLNDNIIVSPYGKISKEFLWKNFSNLIPDQEIDQNIFNTIIREYLNSKSVMYKETKDHKTLYWNGIDFLY